VLDHEAALVPGGDRPQRAQQRIGDLERDHTKDLGVGDRGRRLGRRQPVLEQADADLVDAALALRPRRHLAGEERLVEVGEGVHPDLLGPGGEVVVVEQPRGRDLAGVLEELAPVERDQVAVAGADRGRSAQRAAGLLVDEAGQEQRVAVEAEPVDHLGQPRVLRERLGRQGSLGHGVLLSWGWSTSQWSAPRPVTQRRLSAVQEVSDTLMDGLVRAP
jgi:hypothetical protein